MRTVNNDYGRDVHIITIIVTAGRVFGGRLSTVCYCTEAFTSQRVSVRVGAF